VTDILTPVLTADWDQPDLFTIDGYRRTGGWQALPKALGMSRDEVIATVKNAGLRGRWVPGVMANPPVQRSGEPIPRLVRENRLASPDQIYAGRSLHVDGYPSGLSSASPAPEAGPHTVTPRHTPSTATRIQAPPATMPTRGSRPTMSEYAPHSFAGPPPAASALVVAAGLSSRMRGTDKLFIDLEGRPLLYHTLAAFEACGAISHVMLVLSLDAADRALDAVETESCAYRLQTDDATALVVEVGCLLRDLRVPITELRVGKESLEEVFLRLTGKELES